MRALAIALCAVALMWPAEARADRFEAGLDLYGQGKYAEASVEFEAAYAQKKDPTILFAWAQAVRNTGDCKRAIDMYDDVLTGTLKKAQRDAVTKARTECETQLAEQAASQPAPEPQQPVPEPEPRPVPEPEPRPSPPPERDDGRAWWKDPIGGALLGAGVAGLGVGVGFYISGENADSAADDEDNYFEFVDLKDKAEKRKTIGAVSAAAGGALITGAVLWYVLAGGDDERAQLSGFANDSGAGIVWTSSF